MSAIFETAERPTVRNFGHKSRSDEPNYMLCDVARNRKLHRQQWNATRHTHAVVEQVYYDNIIIVFVELVIMTLGRTLRGLEMFSIQLNIFLQKIVCIMNKPQAEFHWTGL